MISKRARAGAVVLCGLLGLSACATHPPQPYVAPTLDLPPPSLTPLSVDRQWWRVFADPVLDSLVDDALAYNLDLAKAAANVEVARSNVMAANALLSPRVDGLAKAGVTRRQLNVATGNDLNTTTGSAAAGAAVSWEIDLWGRIGQMNEAALRRLAASEHTRNATALSLSSAVVETYFQLLSLDAKLRITQAGRDNLRAVTALERRRWQGGVGTELAYRRSAAELAATESAIPLVEAAVTKTEFALQLMVGRTPRQMSGRLPRASFMPRLPDTPREVDPALLLRRPDVASAEQLLIASNADVNAVRAERYPRLNVSSLVGLLATSSNVISGFPLFFDIGGDLAMPLYDAGLIQSKIDGAQARRTQAEAHFEYTVALAFRETYEAMAMRDASDRQFEAIESEVKLRKQSLELTEKSYAAGQSTKFEVLYETVKVLDAQLSLADARQSQFVARSQIYKALGGGF